MRVLAQEMTLEDLHSQVWAISPCDETLTKQICEIFSGMYADGFRAIQEFEPTPLLPDRIEMIEIIPVVIHQSQKLPSEFWDGLADALLASYQEKQEGGR